jgi:acyl-CoA thioester hydrolase
MLTIKTSIKEIPKATRIIFLHEIYNEKHELLNTGEVTLVFIDTKNKKPVEAPENFLEKIRRYY